MTIRTAVLGFLIALGSWFFTGRLMALDYSKGFVPDEKTAIKIAEVVLTALDSEKWVTDNRPYKAQLKNGVWVVEGRPGSEVIHIEIAKKDGKVSDFYILRDPAF